MAAPVYCTKIASRLIRTYTDRHGLKELVKELLGPGNLQAAANVGLGRARASATRRRNMPPPTCAISTRCKEKLDERLAREGRTALAQACFDFLPHRAVLDLAGWPELDIFAHV